MMGVKNGGSNGGHWFFYGIFPWGYIYIIYYIYNDIYNDIYDIMIYINICVRKKKTQINVHLRDFCFLSSFCENMSVIAPLLAFLHFVHFEAEHMSVFPREISVITLDKSVNTRASSFRLAFSSSSEHKKSE